MIRQADLSSFEPGRSPPGRACIDDDEGDGVPSPVRGRRCARCGHPLGRGGNYAMGWGLLCWNCFQDKGLGRRDGRASASSDASAERNVGYNWRR
jgi:hypothetical protein